MRPAQDRAPCWRLPKRRRRQQRPAQLQRPRLQLQRQQRWQRSCHPCRQWLHHGRQPRRHPLPAPPPQCQLERSRCRSPFSSSSSSSRCRPLRARQHFVGCSRQSRPWTCGRCGRWRLRVFRMSRGSAACAPRCGACCLACCHRSARSGSACSAASAASMRSSARWGSGGGSAVAVVAVGCFGRTMPGSIWDHAGEATPALAAGQLACSSPAVAAPPHTHLQAAAARELAGLPPTKARALLPMLLG